MLRILVAFLACIITASCTQLADTPAPSPVFPGVESVSRLAISPTVAITDRGKIAEFMAALKPLNSAWKYTRHTYPVAAAGVVLVGQSDNALCTVDIGPNWLGSTCGDARKGWPPYVNLSPEQARYFRDFVGGKWNVK